MHHEFFSCEKNCLVHHYCLVLGKFEGKCDEKKIKGKSRKRKKKENKKLI